MTIYLWDDVTTQTELAPFPWQAQSLSDQYAEVRTLNTEPDQRTDIDWYSRARERNVPMLMHEDVVQYYRRHESNTTNDQARSKHELWLMLKDSPARREALGQAGQALPPVPTNGGATQEKEDKV